VPGLLEVRDLTVAYHPGGARVLAARDLTFDVEGGEVVGLLGESGCGKSTHLLAILGLLPAPARVVRGSIRLRGREMLSLSPSELRRIRGAEIAIVFQDPSLALNPVRRVGGQVAEVVRAHRDQSRLRCRDDAVAALDEVGLPEPDRIYDAYPHELSGGQRQRVVLAQALSCRPALLLADEPTAALDATTQAEVLALLASLQARLGLAVLMASHDLGALAALARRVLVMYAGTLVEEGTPAQVFGAPLHPYARGLSRAYPRPAGRVTAPLPPVPIPGSPPDLARLPAGCAFEPRCPDRRAACAERPPGETRPAPGRRVRCYLHE
jgi:oligopeptide/dipeptide ABC transporter ATP-binding protein